MHKAINNVIPLNINDFEFIALRKLTVTYAWYDTIKHKVKFRSMLIAVELILKLLPFESLKIIAIQPATKGINNKITCCRVRLNFIG